MKPEKDQEVIAVMPDQNTLEAVIEDLLAHHFDRHDITVQASHNVLKEKLGEDYIEPEKLMDDEKVPREDPFLHDDYGWIQGFLIALPMFIGAVIGAVMLGDIHDTVQLLLGLIAGGIVGALAGGFVLMKVRADKALHARRQALKGGVVLWVHAAQEKQIHKAKRILKKYHAKNIHTRVVQNSI